MSKYFSVLFVAVCLVSGAAYAQDDATQEFYPSWYWGAHLGKSEISLNQGSQNESFLNVGFDVGYRVTPNLSWEFLMTFATDGERDEVTSFLIGQEAKISADAMGLYLVGQSSGKAYVKGRVGLGFSNIEYSAGGYEDESERTSGLSYGFGAGMEVQPGTRVEIEYIVFPEADDPLYQSASYDLNAFLFQIQWDIR